jgi:hypothetical protein
MASILQISSTAFDRQARKHTLKNLISSFRKKRKSISALSRLIAPALIARSINCYNVRLIGSSRSRIFLSLDNPKDLSMKQSFLLAALLAFSLAACDGGETPPVPPPVQQGTPEATPAPETAPAPAEEATEAAPAEGATEATEGAAAESEASPEEAAPVEPVTEAPAEAAAPADAEAPAQ